MNKEIKVDVAVIGAGVTGLMLTKKLSGLGMNVALVEKGDRLAGGPSTRNEGWLHRGTYHATSIKDRNAAMQVARRCIYGHEQIKRYAPEAIEEPDAVSYALLRNGNRAEEVVSRWDEAHVEYKSLSKKELLRRAPEAVPDHIEEAFQVEDVAVNTRILYRKLLHDAEEAGARVFPRSGIIFDSCTTASRIKTEGESDHTDISPTLVVHANGYGMKQEFSEQFGINIPLRYWKSHLVIADRLADSSLFFLDPGEAAMINHEGFSIVGMNEDALVVDQPDYVPIPEKTANLKAAIKRLFNGGTSKLHQATACVKVDLAENTFAHRSLSIAVFEPIDGHMCVLPGKMTEAPYTTDAMTRMIHGRLSGDDQIALRPVDMVQVSSN